MKTQYARTPAAKAGRMRGLIGRYACLAVFLLTAFWIWAAYEELPDSAVLLSAPLSVPGRSGMIMLASDPYWDHTDATSARHEGKLKCLYGYLVTPLRILPAKPEESEVAVTAAWIHQNGRWSTLLLDDGEGTRKMRRPLFAFGCAGSLFKPSTPTDVIVRIESNGHAGYLRAAPEILRERF